MDAPLIRRAYKVRDKSEHGLIFANLAEIVCKLVCEIGIDYAEFVLILIIQFISLVHGVEIAFGARDYPSSGVFEVEPPRGSIYWDYVSELNSSPRVHGASCCKLSW
ncbi:hypothetical protein QVD17_10005 [Tagetes erecta]|uniref:Uncharacterized protein n=1 Tax=Tagetes erecta TaxID=13708 RepID=A0AAD8P5J8_TARER|nr:hypothetical protein QVD17_10005 [Tagetes erecta]